MSRNETIVRFDAVTYEYNANKPILDEVSFSLRKGAKITIMGQNGAGKSTLFGLITGNLEPVDGEIHIDKGSTRSSQDRNLNSLFENFSRSALKLKSMTLIRKLMLFWKL